MDFWASIEGLINVLAIPVLDNIPVLRAVLGIILVFFAPGFAWSLLFFKNISRLERLVLSAGMSIALVTLSVFAGNLVFHIPVKGSTSLVILLLLTIVPLGIWYGIRYFRKQKPTSK